MDVADVRVQHLREAMQPIAIHPAWQLNFFRGKKLILLFEEQFL